MSSPITDVRPGVFGFDHFPLEAFIRDTVGVITVCRGRVEELGNDMIRIERIAVRECLPVLEDIAPVALIAYHRLTFLILHADREQVPGSRRITVTTTERERQILSILFRFRRIGQIVASAHGVKQHVREMTRIVGAVIRGLKSVVLTNDIQQRFYRVDDGFINLLDSCFGARNEMHQFMDGYRILIHIQYVIPSLTLAVLQGKPRFRNIVGPHSFGFGL